MNAHARLRSRYDKDADVLYISARQEPASRGREDHRGIVWRYDALGHLIGVTIMDYRGLWGGKRRQLTEELSARFSVPSDEVRRALPRG